MRMSLEDLYKEDRLKKHQTSAREIGDLLRIVDRDLKDAELRDLSVDRRFATAYNAALGLATITLYSKGFRPTGVGHHYTVFQAMKETMGDDYVDLANYFDACRVKRNAIDYDRSGRVSEGEADRLLIETRQFKEIVRNWLQTYYPQFLGQA
jgi:uncharacterized protein (UPF0332 family)